MRERKKINYASFGDDNDFDDDFADPTPPSKKKTPSSNKENKNSKKAEKTSNTGKTEKKKTNRLSVDEKLYERQLQEALNLSLSESQDSNGAVNLENPSSPQEQVSVTVESTNVGTSDSIPDCLQVEADITNCKPCSDIPPTDVKVCNTTKRPAEDSDEIQVLDKDISDDEEQPAKRRKLTTTTKKKSKYVESDSEGSEFDADSDSDEDFSDDGDDSDFGAEIKSKKKGKTKNPPAAKKTEPKAKTTKTKPSTACKETKSAPKSRTPAPSTKTLTAARKSYTSPVSASVPTRGAVTSGLTGRKVAWTPPAPASSCKSSAGCTLASPTSGIRLGLSRNQRVKPLHPSLKVQQ